MKKKLLIISASLLLIFAIGIGVYVHYHPTYFFYNDSFILGNTPENIIGRYGEFTIARKNASGEIVYGAYMIRDNTPELIMSYDNSLWYEVYFGNGTAYEVRLQEGRRGG